MESSEVIRRLVQFNRTEKPVYVKLYERLPNGDVIKSVRFPVQAVFAHNQDYAEIIIEQSQQKDAIDNV